MSRWMTRALQPSDLPGLMEVQIACYGEGFAESTEVFARRLRSAANCSLVIEHEGSVCAYLAAYRSMAAKVTPLHGDFEPVLAPDTLYLHDMAVHPGYAGQGLAHTLLQEMRAMARSSLAGRLPYSGLVSVQGSQAYWERQGYALHALADATQRARLATYGDDAVYMLARWD